MVDSLPLIPAKDGPCTDVRNVLRSVFRDTDYLPPLPAGHKLLAKAEFKDSTLPDSEYWVNEYATESKDICNREDEIKHLHAKRVAREPLPNIFKLYEPTAARPLPTWTFSRGLLHRKDLVPAIEQNAGRDGTLWVKNILNASSCDIDNEKVNISEVATPITLNSSDVYSLQTFSIGPVVEQSPPPTPFVPPPPSSPNYVICVPPQLEFLNCTVGQVYVQCIRLINVSKFECRLSVTPPKRPELEVVIASSRGLTVTSGAKAELSVRFKPTVVRVVKDTLVVRVSSGQIFEIAILCYMEPPVLEITVPHVDPPLTAVPAQMRVEAPLRGASGGAQVVELGARLLGDVHCARVFLHCASEHAAFFILTEDAWMNWDIDDPEAYAGKSEPVADIKVEPAQAEVLPRSTNVLHVRLRDVGAAPGLRRAVLRLILKDIPKESFPKGYEPIILNTTEVQSDPIPGFQGSVRSVCEVLCAELEVWWEVVPLRFTVMPPAVPLHHSRRLSSINVRIAACQLLGRDRSRAAWATSPCSPPAPPLQLSAAECVATRFKLPLPATPNNYPETDVFTLVAAHDEWKSECAVTRQCEPRHPALRPARSWLGVVAPKTRMRTVLSIHNNTYQDIWFWCGVHRWVGESPPSAACAGRAPCARCQERACTCALLAPTRGALPDGHSAEVTYCVNAPEVDGCVATLVAARRCSPDLAAVAGAAGTAGRAALVAYRVLAPLLVARVLPCGGDQAECEAACALDAGAALSPLGAALLRPGAALARGRRTCYRLRLTNVTPLPTSVRFDRQIDGVEFIKVKFIPNEFNVRSFGEVEVRVVLSAVAVCARRVVVLRAAVLRAHRPLYVVLDAAVQGVEVSVQVPTGGGIITDEFVIMRRTQREAPHTSKRRLSAPVPHEIFAEEDRRRAVIRANVCQCPIHLTYIAPVQRPKPPLPQGEYPPVEIVTRPPSLTRVCRCFPHSKPFIPDPPHSISLEFRNMALNQVYERRLILRNESVVTAHWSTVVRKWPRRDSKRTIGTDEWARGVNAPGVAVACSPARGVLGAHAHVELRVQVCADCWGLYADQLLVQVDDVDPIVLDVWMEVIGSPMQFKIQPVYKPDELPSIWLSRSDWTRTLAAKNLSRSDLFVHAYVTHNSGRAQDALPFRLHARLVDAPPRSCPCLTAQHDEWCEQSASSTSSLSLEMETGVELFLAPDCGPQDDTYYSVSPKECTIKAGEQAHWELALAAPPAPGAAPHATLVFRLTPLDARGDGWHRAPPAPQRVQLRQAERAAELRASCDEVLVSICVLDLPYGDFLRVRKRFQLLNVGNGELQLSVQTSFPWCVVSGRASHRAERAPGRGAGAPCGAGCGRAPRGELRAALVSLDLPPRSSTEVCVEVCVSTLEAWPAGTDDSSTSLCVAPYAPRRRLCTPLFLYDDTLLLKTLPLIVELEYPEIRAEPHTLDFGFVTDADTRKSYISVSHTNATKTLTLVVRWKGCPDFKLWPRSVAVAPGGSAHVYVQYTAVWRRRPAEGSITVSVCCGAGGCGVGGAPGWCRAVVAVRAVAALDQRWHAPPHDHTDDDHLLPVPDQLHH